LVADLGISIGIIATPATVAQAVAERMVDAGIGSILNFAPTVINVPEEISVRKVDLAVELQILSFYNERRSALGAAG
jgi:redox-sensing transcriptional repressor